MEMLYIFCISNECWKVLYVRCLGRWLCVRAVQIKPQGPSSQTVQNLQIIQGPGGQLQVRGLLPGIFHCPTLSLLAGLACRDCENMHICCWLFFNGFCKHWPRTNKNGKGTIPAIVSIMALPFFLLCFYFAKHVFHNFGNHNNRLFMVPQLVSTLCFVMYTELCA